jgi:hypothetical protein
MMKSARLSVAVLPGSTVFSAALRSVKNREVWVADKVCTFPRPAGARCTVSPRPARCCWTWANSCAGSCSPCALRGAYLVGREHDVGAARKRLGPNRPGRYRSRRPGVNSNPPKIGAEQRLHERARTDVERMTGRGQHSLDLRRCKLVTVRYGRHRCRHRLAVEHRAHRPIGRLFEHIAGLSERAAGLQQPPLAARTAATARTVRPAYCRKDGRCRRPTPATGTSGRPK